MGPPPRVPLVLLLLLAAERTARGSFPEEPGPIAVAPPDCECPLGAGGAALGHGGGTAWHGKGKGIWDGQGRRFGVKAGGGTQGRVWE